MRCTNTKNKCKLRTAFTPISHTVTKLYANVGKLKWHGIKIVGYGKKNRSRIDRDTESNSP
jgi:hypothetical protein